MSFSELNMSSGQAESINPGLEFENFLRSSLPELLNLSPSKRVAMHLVFYRFSDYANVVMGKLQTESKSFLSEFEKRVRRVSKFRTPKGHKVVPSYEELREGTIKYHMTRKLT